jgi:hypothetical protein
LIGGLGEVGDAAGEWRRRGSGGAAVATEIRARSGVGLVNVRHGELPCDLGKVLGMFSGLEGRRRYKLGGGFSAVAAGARAPTSWQSGQGNRWAGKLDHLSIYLYY